MSTWFAILLGGGLGALSRYFISGWAYRLLGGRFPWGTLVVNLIGCFLIGALWELAQRAAITPAARMFVFMGALGGFTTFSTFGIETVNLLRDGEFATAALNVAVSNIAGIGLVIAGILAARAMIVMSPLGG